MKKILLIFIALIALLAIGLFILLLVKKPEDKETTPSQEEETQQDNISGNLEFNLLEVEDIDNFLDPRDGIPGEHCYKTEETEGKFIRVRFKVKNIGNANGSPQVVAITDSRNNITDVGSFLCWTPWEEEIIFRQSSISPGEEKVFSFIADIPSDSQGLILNILDSPDEEDSTSTRTNKMLRIPLGI